MASLNLKDVFPPGLCVIAVEQSDNEIQITLAMNRKTARCPRCQRRSRHIHSRYLRFLADLPMCSRTVHLKVQVRKFFCRNPVCKRVVFAEPIAALAARYARRTQRLDSALTAMACELGGEAGSRISTALKLGEWSADTLLQLIRRMPESPALAITPHVLGVDEGGRLRGHWAKRKGFTYGTILCDLERHCVIELLPDRDSATLADWLQSHPGVEIVCRDRANAYADGVRIGAPNAIQVADRFHVLVNLSDVVARVVDRHRHLLKVNRVEVISVAEKQISTAESQASQVNQTDPPPRPYRGQLLPRRRPPSPIRAHQALRRELRAQKWDRVRKLHTDGLSQREIGRQLKMDHHTIRRILTTEGEGCPDNGNRWRGIRPVADFLEQRWHAGEHNARQLQRELNAMGHAVNYHAVMYFIHSLRWAAQAVQAVQAVQAAQTNEHSQVHTASAQALGQVSVSDKPPPPTQIKTRVLSVRQAAQLIGSMRPLNSEQDHQLLQQLCSVSPELARTHELATGFRMMFRERQQDKLDPWLARATGSNVAEFKSFADSLERDKAAISAALSSEWSSGQVEGQVNRLKLIKRLMYGRGKLDLLRKRVLYKPASP